MSRQIREEGFLNEVNNSTKTTDLNEYGMFERQTDFKEQKEWAKENKK